MDTQDPNTAPPARSELEVEIVKNPDRSRYEARWGDDVIGFAQYVQREGVIEFPETFVDPAYEGHGVASQLARFSLDEVRERGTERVIPTCWFYAGWIERHPDYADLLGPAASGASASTSEG